MPAPWDPRTERSTTWGAPTPSNEYYREYYTDETRDLVAKAFAEDIAQFGYGFDGPVTAP